jgi:uncharacterized membrane protein YdjX (TVP38/TMEM64 family)
LGESVGKILEQLLCFEDRAKKMMASLHHARPLLRRGLSLAVVRGSSRGTGITSCRVYSSVGRGVAMKGSGRGVAGVLPPYHFARSETVRCCVATNASMRTMSTTGSSSGVTGSSGGGVENNMLATTSAIGVVDGPSTFSLEELVDLMNHLPDVAATLIAHSPPCPTAMVALSTAALVTANDVVPCFPCQPLVMAVASQLGIWAFPICVTGQTLGGVLAFGGARMAANSGVVKGKAMELLKGNDKALEKFKEFQAIGSNSKESMQLAALMGLRLTPFFPFTSGNYVLGSATSVGYRPFALATLFGCCVSQIISVGVGMGGAELVKSALM